MILPSRIADRVVGGDVPVADDEGPVRPSGFPSVRTAWFTSRETRVPMARSPASSRTFVAMRRSPWKMVAVPMSLSLYFSPLKTMSLTRSTISKFRLRSTPP